ncbi:MAG TPA: enoyl-CoA hydratase-related protein [Acidimicrobiales bacterium]|nr:enoyl-CoA hydratase-related protein [Acidimicrobiales bacterium]
MADEDVVLHEVRDDGVGILTLNRPERMNAWTGELETRYFQLLEDFDKSDDVRAIVVTGAGRGFCPGADMDLLQGLGGGGESLAAADRKPVTFPLTVRKPLIGAINGACAGVGLVQALMFDVRFAAAGAKFTFAFARRGLIAEYGSSWILPRLTGMSRAIDLMMSSRVFTAEEALDLGVVNYVVPKEEVLDAAIAYASDIAQNCSPTSIAVMKQQLYSHALLDVDSALAESNKLMRESLAREDFKEGVKSYVEKRPPAFPPLGA